MSKSTGDTRNKQSSSFSLPCPTSTNLLVSLPIPHVLKITLNRPEKKNAINGDMYLEMAEIINDLSLDDTQSKREIKAILITGIGDYFSSGADLTDSTWDIFSIGANDGNEENEDEDRVKSNNEGNLEKENRTMNQSPAAVFMRSIVNCDNKLIVAAVNGHCVGIAVTLLVHCDLVISVDYATFYVPFFQMAIVPEFASSFIFPSIMGIAKANNLLICGDKITAKQAYDYNIVGEIIDVRRPTRYNRCNNLNEEKQNVELLQYAYTKLEKVMETPLSRESIPIFKKVIRQNYMPIPIIKEIIKEEFEIFDRRIVSGEVFDAVLSLLEKKREKKDHSNTEIQSSQKRQFQSKL